MGLFDWLFGKRGTPVSASTGKRYEFPTGNLELAIRIARGEPLETVMGEIMAMWEPGNEHLWDEYDVESLVDSDEKQGFAVNQLIYARISIYRALKRRGRDVRGTDPFLHLGDCEEESERLKARFPSAFRLPGVPSHEPAPGPDGTTLSGLWVGNYYQHNRACPIETELVQAGDRLTGSMRDVQTDTASSVFEVAAEAGLPPGADEQIEARLRELFPDAQASPIRYVTHLPPESSLEGWVRGRRFEFLKTYRGEHYGGYKVGDRMVGQVIEGHSVHYGGVVSADGQEVEGKWWIGPPPGSGPRRAEGSFTLRRQAGG